MTHRDELNAVQSALEINKRTGERVFTFNAGYTVGEGYLKGGMEFRTTTNVTAVFDGSGRLKTMYPDIDETRLP